MNALGNQYQFGSFEQDLEEATNRSLRPSPSPPSSPEQPQETVSELAKRQLAAVSTPALKKPSTLRSLTQEERNATFGTGPAYSLWFSAQCQPFHAEGDTWSDDKHEQFFTQGLLRHYITENSGFRFHYNYEMWEGADYATLPTSPYDRIVVESLSSLFGLEAGLSPRQILPYARVLKALIQKYCNHSPALIQLGGLFQRKKVEGEKATERAQNSALSPEERESAQRQAYRLDREAEKLQLIICNWVKDGMSQIYDFVTKKALSAIRIDLFSPSLPDFLDNEKYSLTPFGIDLSAQQVTHVILDERLTDARERSRILERMGRARAFEKRLH